MKLDMDAIGPKAGPRRGKCERTEGDEAAEAKSVPRSTTRATETRNIVLNELRDSDRCATKPRKVSGRNRVDRTENRVGVPKFEIEKESSGCTHTDKRIMENVSQAREMLCSLAKEVDRHRSCGEGKEYPRGRGIASSCRED